MRLAAGRHMQVEASVAVPALDGVFERVEPHCPRMFPAGSSRTRFVGAGTCARKYSRSETSATITRSGGVFRQHFRALIPSVIGKALGLRQGIFSLDCSRLPGRYVPPWERD
jgi:hypothetical protein